jgi:hypothetical protein
MGLCEQAHLTRLSSQELRYERNRYVVLQRADGYGYAQPCAEGQVSLNVTAGGIIRRGAAYYYTLTVIALFVCVMITVIGVREAPSLPGKFQRSRQR